MMVRELLMYILLIKTIQSISAKMYYVLFSKILRGGDTASGTVLHKRILEFVLRISDKYTYKEFLKITASNN